jgi:thiaminase
VQLYLDSWTFASSHLSDAVPRDSAIRHFISNWTSKEFVEFVDDIALHVDNLGIEPGTSAWQRAEDIWARVIELEVDFWPDPREDIGIRLA